jgi:hypothetical protein
MNAQELAQKAARCVHFTGIQNKTCAAGCTYSRPVASVCFPSRIDGQMANPHPCSSYAPTGAEAVKKQEAEFEKMFEDTNKARAAIIAKEGTNRRVSGAIPCPVCNQGPLRYSIASNGHVHAKCMTPECVCWME